MFFQISYLVLYNDRKKHGWPTLEIGIKIEIERERERERERAYNPKFLETRLKFIYFLYMRLNILTT